MSIYDNNKTSQCSFVSWGHHPALTTNIFTSIWPIEDKQELWWPAKHTTERPANKTTHCTYFKGWSYFDRRVFLRSSPCSTHKLVLLYWFSRMSARGHMCKTQAFVCVRIWAISYCIGGYSQTWNIPSLLNNYYGSEPSHHVLPTQVSFSGSWIIKLSAFITKEFVTQVADTNSNLLLMRLRNLLLKYMFLRYLLLRNTCISC